MKIFATIFALMVGITVIDLVAVAQVKAKEAARAVALPVVKPPAAEEDKGRFVDPPLVLVTWSNFPVKMRKGDGYGAMLINARFASGEPDHGEPRYILAVEDGRKIVDTEDAAVFLAALKESVPKGATVYPYCTCLVGTAAGLSAEQRDAWAGMFKDAGVELSEDFRGTCTCP